MLTSDIRKHIETSTSNITPISRNMNQYTIGHNKNVKELAEAYKQELVQRITRNLLAREEKRGLCG